MKLSKQAIRIALSNGIQLSTVRRRIELGWCESAASSTPVLNQTPYYYIISKENRFVKECGSTSQVARFLSEKTEKDITKNMVIGMLDRHGATAQLFGYVIYKRLRETKKELNINDYKE